MNTLEMIRAIEREDPTVMKSVTELAKALSRLLEGIDEAIAVLDDGTPYQKLHVSAILSAAKKAFTEFLGL